MYMKGGATPLVEGKATEQCDSISGMESTFLMVLELRVSIWKISFCSVFMLLSVVQESLQTTMWC